MTRREWRELDSDLGKAQEDIEEGRTRQGLLAIIKVLEAALVEIRDLSAPEERH